MEFWQAVGKLFAKRLKIFCRLRNWQKIHIFRPHFYLQNVLLNAKNVIFTILRKKIRKTFKSSSLRVRKHLDEFNFQKITFWNVPLEYSEFGVNCKWKRKFSQMRTHLNDFVSSKISNYGKVAVEKFLENVFFPTILRFWRKIENLFSVALVA